VGVIAAYLCNARFHVTAFVLLLGPVCNFPRFFSLGWQQHKGFFTTRPNIHLSANNAH
jgi:hypothetical protein